MNVSQPYRRSPARRLVRTLLPCMMLMLAAGCAADSLGAGVPIQSNEVRVIDNGFEPAVIQIPVGDPVGWTWEGSRDHNVVGDGFQSATQSSGTFTHTFDQPGNYEYECTLHGGMRGEIIVGD